MTFANAIPSQRYDFQNVNWHPTSNVQNLKVVDMDLLDLLLSMHHAPHILDGTVITLSQ